MNSSQQYSWSLQSNPVLYDLKTACSKNELGKAEHDFTARHGPIQIPTLDGKEQVFTDSEITLQGPKSIWGRSLLIRNLNLSVAEETCSNVFDSGEVRTAEAVFTSPLAGNVIFRENERMETIIFSNLFYVGDDYRSASRHDWKILVTDISDPRRSKKCDYLDIIFDPNSSDDKLCSQTNHSHCKVGDLTRKHGTIAVGATNSRYSKQFFVDTNLPLSAIEGTRKMYLVLYDKNNANRVMTCAEIFLVERREVKALIDMFGVKGHFIFSQRYRMDPTVVNIELKNLNGRAKFYHIHEFPLPPRRLKEENLCSDIAVGGHFNPYGINVSLSPPPGIGTNDKYEVGDLSGKFGTLSDGRNHSDVHVDMNLPLFGPNTIIGRSMVLHKPNKERWICATIGYAAPTITAVATFVYPIVGEVVFRQEKDKPWSETTVLVDLSYADGSVNDTENHAWHVHVNEPSRDFYGWSKRCESAGGHFNPFNVGLTKYSKCNNENPYRCEVGDLTSKSKRIKIAAYKGSTKNRHFYTDVLLPLSGPYSIVGRSLVVHDDFANKVRGNRMACAPIRVVHPLMATVREWKVGTGDSSNITGSMIFSQPTEYDETTTKIELQGLNRLAGGFDVHEVWVPQDKEFPCSADAVYDHFNPFAVSSDVGPSPKVGSSDQYEVGDLSGKYGSLEGKLSLRGEFVDSNLALHGANSIVSRSIVIHKKEKRFRWVCGTVKIEAKKGEAREIVALASFDDSRHLVSGYIRFRQYEYKDGSTSNTWLEVDLKHAGFHNKNITFGHNWAVYVTQVGEDAFSSAEKVRCLASGYRWNPYLVDSKNEIYKKDCNKVNPLRCEMGDLSGKHGPLVIGQKRFVYTDVNLPLVGNYSILGRSVVLFSKNGGDVKLACTNIKPDIHIVSNVAVRKYPTFTVSKFMETMRTLLNTTDFLVSNDIQNSREILDGECLQLKVHFYGAEAYRLQIEFGNLINLGSVQRQDRFGTHTISTYYQPCRTRKS
ncbi:uncharacterized protein B4U79_07981 [Dinothrombium tinctorium]|uniref:Superoxide dismutase copper/zinc binding domain-containing protein n=1 Tax=Dinothrombium tinctorium TaxID=1965070 RepID=A0A443QZU2_9ACAR|nr:uncharacterized protein B4U79_07981 [Dinothrombium tinctorium]